MVISTGLKVLYSFLCREYINHIIKKLGLIKIQQDYEKQVTLRGGHIFDLTYITLSVKIKEES
jgi:hypothetical protein